VEFEVPTAVVMESSTFKDITPCSPLQVNRHLKGEEKGKQEANKPIAVVERSKARTVFACSNTANVGSNPTEAWMFVCVLCAFFLFLHSLK
jgi:hypothetical protein